MQIIPALYVKDHKLAVYRPGDYDNISYLDQDPYELLSQLGELKIDRIHLIDVDASLPGEPKNNSGLIGSLSNTCISDIEVGGGITEMGYLKSLQYAGVDLFVLGSVVIDDFAFLREIAEADDVQNDKIVISLDVKDGNLTFHGWTEEVPELTLNQIIWKCINIGFRRFIVTEVDTVDPHRGPNIPFYTDLMRQYPDTIITAAGNINRLEDVEQLAAVGMQEAIMGEKIFDNEFAALAEIAEYNRKQKDEDE